MSNETGKERFTSYLPVHLIEKIRDISEKTGIPQTRLLERAIEDYLAKYEKQMEILEKL